jgi:plasmid stabilization system protein ParE
MRVRYTPRARSDLQTILEYLDRQCLQGARNVKRAIKKTIAVIGRHPHGGRHLREQGTHVFPVGKYAYLIYWSVETDGEVWITHIRHMSRRPWDGQ